MSSTKAKDINFYSSFEDPTKKENEKKTIGLAIGGAVVILLVGGIGAGFAYTQTLAAEIDSLQSEANDPTLLKKISEAESMSQETVTLNIRIKIYQDNDQEIQNSNSIKEKITNTLMEEVKNCESSGATVSAFSYANGTCSFTISAPTEEKCADYVQRLRNTGLFYQVDYSGYSQGSSTEGGDVEFTYDLSAQFEKETETEVNG